MLSRTFRHGSSAGSWKATPIWWSSRARRRRASVDADACPTSVSSSPASIRSTVDLPHPDGPSSAVSVPIAAV